MADLVLLRKLEMAMGIILAMLLLMVCHVILLMKMMVM